MKILNFYVFLICIFCSNLLYSATSLNKESDDFIDSYPERAQEKILKRERRLKEISENYFLMFFYYGLQEASKKSAPCIQTLAQKYDWLTYAISLDETLIDGFENNKLNNGIFEEFRRGSPYPNFKGPMLFLFNPQKRGIIFIAAGSSDFECENIENHIYGLFYPLD